MAKVMIVPTEDYKVLKKYLGTDINGRLVLVPEESLRTFPPAVQTRCRNLAHWGDVTYDFGGEPDICADLIISKNSYAYGTLLERED